MLNSLSLLGSGISRFFFNHRVQIRERASCNVILATTLHAIEIGSAT